MKEYIQTAVVFAVMLMIIPCVVFLGDTHGSAAPAADETSSLSAVQSGKVKILFTKEKQVREYDTEEYVLGAVLAQMPADFEPAALQAQAVLARTYAAYRTKAESLSPTPQLDGAVMSDDTTLYQGFFTEAQAKDFYGSSYSTARSKVLQAVKATQGRILTYGGQPIIIAFHALSDGYTRSAKDAWGQDIPYLQSAESKWDAKLDFFKSKAVFTQAQFKEKLSAIDSTLTFSDSPEDWLKVTKTGEHGCVSEVTVSGKALSGSDFCRALDLNSPDFSFEVKDGSFTFTVCGVGHLVGMSQYGANAMAKEGKSCEEILSHYFSGCKLLDNSQQADDNST